MTSAEMAELAERVQGNEGWEQKCWGRVRHMEGTGVSTSILEVVERFRCSVHYHEKRCNSFLVVRGELEIVSYGTIQGERVETSRDLLRAGNSMIVWPKRIHRFDVIRSGDVVECYWNLDGTKPEFSDIVRFDEGGKL